MTDILSLTLKQIEEVLIEMKQPKYRGAQLFEWLHVKKVDKFEQMTNLPKPFLELLSGLYYFPTFEVVTEYVSVDGTKKLLFRLNDGATIETVSMQYKHGHSICISSQVGCRMGCTFCASTLGGLIRQLSAGEMLGQVYAIEKITGQTVDSIVIMGSGEPFDNYEAFLDFYENIHNEKGKHLSARHITVSTCGLADKIRDLGDRGLKVNLAISLHAPTDALRETMMPITRKYPIKEVIESVKYYFEKTGRRVTFEYSLVQGVNDGEQEGIALAALLKGINCHINLIPINPVRENDYKQSSQANIQKFKQILEKNHLTTTVRRELGTDINAACGQLRVTYEKNQIIEEAR